MLNTNLDERFAYWPMRPPTNPLFGMTTHRLGTSATEVIAFMTTARFPCNLILKIGWLLEHYSVHVMMHSVASTNSYDYFVEPHIWLRVAIIVRYNENSHATAAPFSQTAPPRDDVTYPGGSGSICTVWEKSAQATRIPIGDNHKPVRFRHAEFLNI